IVEIRWSARPRAAGTVPTTRSPTGPRPYKHAIDVLAPASSRNTNRRASTPAARLRKAARFWRTSGRSCSAVRGTFVYPQQATAPGDAAAPAVGESLAGAATLVAGVAHRARRSWE